MEGCVARQPIFNTAMGVYGYELLYRASPSSVESGMESDQPDDVMDGNAATSETIITSFQHIGIKKLTTGKRAFVNFTKDLLIAEVATLWPKNTLVVEVLEGILPTPEILSALQNIKRAGYLIALDDFIISPEYFPYLPFADIVKIDFLTTPLEQIRTVSASLLLQKKVLLAEKVESEEVYQQAVKMGFTLFQGFFFSKPTTITQRKTDPLKLNCLQLMRLSMQEDVSFQRLADVVKRDVSLCFSLLKLVNSAYFALPQKIKGIEHALFILGLEEIAKWVTLVSMSRMKQGKPDELVYAALMRGHILESLAGRLRLHSQKTDLALVGMFSLMDILMDSPMEEIVRETFVSDFIAQTLLDRASAYGGLLDMLAAYEAGNWDEALALADHYEIAPEILNGAYLDALEWVQSISF